MNANRMPLKRHENVCVFYRELPTYNPQKTMESDPYIATSGNVGEACTRDKNVSGYTTENIDGSRFPLSYMKYSNDTGIHPTQKPVALFEYLIRTYTNKGDLVLDNCAGSGTTTVACKKLGRDFIVIEKEEFFYNKILERMGMIEKFDPPIENEFQLLEDCLQ